MIVQLSESVAMLLNQELMYFHAVFGYWKQGYYGHFCSCGNYFPVLINFFSLTIPVQRSINILAGRIDYTNMQPAIVLHTVLLNLFFFFKSWPVDVYIQLIYSIIFSQYLGIVSMIYGLNLPWIHTQKHTVMISSHSSLILHEIKIQKSYFDRLVFVGHDHS